MKNTATRMIVTMLAAAALPLGSYAAYAQNTTKADPEFVAKLRAALQENPEIVLEAAQRAQMLAEARQRSEQTRLAEPVRQELIARNTPGLIVGNPNGNIAMVEFLDYNCGYCKRSHPEVEAYLKATPAARFVIMMRPILGPGSTTLARYALAADMQGKFAVAHHELMGERVEPTDAALEALSNKIGVNWGKAKADMASKTVTDRLSAHESYAERLNVRGTPFFILPNRVVPGAMTRDQFSK